MRTIPNNPTTSIYELNENKSLGSPPSRENVFSQAFSDHNCHYDQTSNQTSRYNRKSHEAREQYAIQEPSPPLSAEDEAMTIKPQESENSFTYNNIQLEEHDFSTQLQSFDPNNAYNTANRLIREVEGGLHQEEWPEEYTYFGEDLAARYGNSRGMAQNSERKQQENTNNSTFRVPSLQTELSTASSSGSGLGETSHSITKQYPGLRRTTSKQRLKIRKQRTQSKAEKATQHKAFLARNRKAASNCRMRKRDLEEHLNQVCGVQRERNTSLTMEYKDLLLQVNQLKGVVKDLIGEDDTRIAVENELIADGDEFWEEKASAASAARRYNGA